jgi:hypothetical protein
VDCARDTGWPVARPIERSVLLDPSFRDRCQAWPRLRHVVNTSPRSSRLVERTGSGEDGVSRGIDRSDVFPYQVQVVWLEEAAHPALPGACQP